MSKEQLEEAKYWLGSTFTNSNYEIVLAEDIGIPRELLEWLIEQAERVQELDKELDRVKVKYRATKEYAYVSMPKISEKNESLTNQNKYYRESINLSLNHIHTGNFNLATVALNKALLKEVDK